MSPLRRLIASNRTLAALIVAAALLLRVLVPAGFMPDVAAGRITITLCTGAGPATMTMPMAMPAGGRHDAPAPAGHDMPCAFAGLAAPMLGGADAILLAVALLFAFAAAFGDPPALAVRRLPRLRPPLRGPPAAA